MKYTRVSAPLMHPRNVVQYIDNLPTYSELIRLLHKSEQEQTKNCNLATLLVSNFKELYPHVDISRADRFLDTVRRIAVPTLPSSLGTIKLTGASLQTYLD